MGGGEVIKGSLSAEIGPVLIGVVSHAGSPRPESPTRQGSVAHIGREALALQQETPVEQARLPAVPSPPFCLLVHQAGMLWTRLRGDSAHLRGSSKKCAG